MKRSMTLSSYLLSSITLTTKTRCRNLSVVIWMNKKWTGMEGSVTVVVDDRPLAETKVVGDLLHLCERSISRIDPIVEFLLPFIRDLGKDHYAL